MEPVGTTLDAARAGDEDAFAALTGPHLRELHVHCYRMLGSLDDADDALQDVLLAAWRGLPTFAGRSSVRTWLYTIATHRCLNVLRAGRRRPAEVALPFDAPPPDALDDPTTLQPYPDAWLPAAPVTHGPDARWDAAESIELAFVAALQALPPRQVAAVVLADVLGFGVAECAAMLDMTPTVVKGLRQRGRTSLAAARASSRTGGDVDLAVARRFARALESGDVDAVVALLTDDAWLAMPPLPHVYRGREHVAAFLRAAAGWRTGRTLTLAETAANGRPAFVGELTDATGVVRPAGVYVVTTCGGRVASATRFLDDGVAGRFAAPCPRP
ncbi:sigma-70 family RNA polymerase sigma factor [Cellulomonas sp. H30R-01]|uniref:RNA polymerase subunit sigma-70 n=1 Tax=Cellulomonas sp. H30R-01 TaxID=2704467 RepID=UPI00138BFB03|nr:RNA polymerase subunit sigma-70 [Cellulomonas sp. H30R-01]QHT56829.1 sigma-70 family RNA polymerase sigma factor [Cellulomonas sp. H30R-01]